MEMGEIILNVGFNVGGRFCLSESFRARLLFSSYLNPITSSWPHGWYHPWAWIVRMVSRIDYEAKNP